MGSSAGCFKLKTKKLVLVVSVLGIKEKEQRVEQYVHCCFCARHAALKRKSKEWNNMSIVVSVLGMQH
jgi:hypothetical protein